MYGPDLIKLYGSEIYGNEFKWWDPHSQELVFVIQHCRFSGGYFRVK